jgi:RNA polymerase sigma-70 factor, ECF subfamily
MLVGHPPPGLGSLRGWSMHPDAWRRGPSEDSHGAPEDGTVPVQRAPGGHVGSDAEQRLVAALRRGDESAFTALVDAHAAAMLRLARAYVPSRSVAEEVVQETWLALLEGLDRFEERSSVKTWLFRVVVNIAKTRAVRERRTTPFSALPQATGDEDGDNAGPLVDPARFLPPDHEQWPGHWAQPPQSWRDNPELSALSHEVLDEVGHALDGLSARQRATVLLRDVEGFSAEEVCDLLAISAANQRVLLHRGRAHVRQALEDYLAGSHA